VYEALLGDKQLEIKYLKRGEEKAVDYRIHPLAAVQRGTVTYLFCRLFDYEDFRTLALHRIQSANILEDAAKIPTGFSIDDEINKGRFGFGEGKQIRLEAVFYNGSGDHLFETALSSNQTLTEQADGSLTLNATVADTPQLAWWLLGLGDGVEIVKPASLRKTLASTIAKMHAIYGV
jgi:predicted DNA-binding transcriptional regulator YafY